MSNPLVIARVVLHPRKGFDIQDGRGTTVSVFLPLAVGPQLKIVQEESA